MNVKNSEGTKRGDALKKIQNWKGRDYSELKELQQKYNKDFLRTKKYEHNYDNDKRDKRGGKKIGGSFLNRGN
jgi:hypothetical protein